MSRIIQKAIEMALFIVLLAVVTGIWVWLWLPPF
jgi:hypothetical protein